MSFEPQNRLYARTLRNPETCMDRDLWIQMWSALLKMDALEELRVRVRPPQNGWIGMEERDILESMGKFPKPLKVFDVELPRISNTGTVHDPDEAAALPK